MIIINLLVLIEILFLINIARFKSLVHPYTIAYFIAFFYFNSVYIDFLFFDFTPRFVNDKVIIVDFHSEVFFEYTLLSFFYFLTFFLCVVVDIEIYKSVINEVRNRSNIKFKAKSFVYFILFLFILYNIYEIINGFSLTRIQKGEVQNAANLLFRNIINYSFILLFCLKNKYSLLLKMFFITNIGYFLFSFEREPLIIIFLCLIFKYNIFKKTKYVLLGGLALIILLFVWKNFYTTFLYQDGAGKETFVNNFKNSDFTFSGLDPQASFLMFYDYLQNPNIYKDYKFSYLTGVYYQMERFFIESNYKTIAEFSSSFYTNNEYGTATSVLLESLLNFSILGPIVISFLIFYFLKKGTSLKIKLGPGIIVAILYIITKLMRTEIATMLKLQILPLLLAIVLFKYLITNYTDNDVTEKT